jgi:hypothetical protein
LVAADPPAKLTFGSRGDASVSERLEDQAYEYAGFWRRVLASSSIR